MLVVRVDVVVLQLLGLLEEQDGEQEQHVAADQLEEEQLVGGRDGRRAPVARGAHRSQRKLVVGFSTSLRVAVSSSHSTPHFYQVATLVTRTPLKVGGWVPLRSHSPAK